MGGDSLPHLFAALRMPARPVHATSVTSVRFQIHSSLFGLVKFHFKLYQDFHQKRPLVFALVNERELETFPEMLARC